MHRGRRILVISHCLLNMNAKVFPNATAPAAQFHLLEPFLRDGVALFQLPCPEVAHLGCNRWGMTREQYDQPAYRRTCTHLLQPVVDQLESYVKDGCRIEAILGIEGSPSCGVFTTCEGHTGGRFHAEGMDVDAATQSRKVPGEGVFIMVLKDLLDVAGLSIPFWGVQERAGTIVKHP